MDIWNLNERNKHDILSNPIYLQNQNQGRIVALGYFDGVHKGHKEILKFAAENAQKKGMISTVHSFTTPPVSKKNENNAIPYHLTEEKEKLELFEKYGTGEVFLTPFEKAVKQLSPEAFLEIYIAGLFKAKGIVTGEDYRFGKNREGDVSFLKKWGAENGVDVIIVPALKRDNKVISSTWIRLLIRDGHIEIANELLGYPLSFSGIVEKGYQIGRTIQFPTANMKISPEKMIPNRGVYVSIFEVDGKQYPSISNIGIRPTMQRNEKTIYLETMLFDQNLNLYGKEARVFLIHFIRAEMNFETVDSLSMQMKKDALLARAYHAKHRSAYSIFFPTML